MGIYHENEKLIGPKWFTQMTCQYFSYNSNEILKYGMSLNTSNDELNNIVVCS